MPGGLCFICLYILAPILTSFMQRSFPHKRSSYYRESGMHVPCCHWPGACFRGQMNVKQMINLYINSKHLLCVRFRRRCWSRLLEEAFSPLLYRLNVSRCKVSPTVVKGTNGRTQYGARCECNWQRTCYHPRVNKERRNDLIIGSPRIPAKKPAAHPPAAPFRASSTCRWFATTDSVNAKVAPMAATELRGL